jgi:hypothetical protein
VCYGLLLAGLWAVSARCPAASADVSYLVFNRAPEQGFDQQHPYTINSAGFREVMRPFEGLPASRIRPGLSFVFSYFKSDIETVKLALERFLAAAEQTDTPVLVKFDGEQWWQNRPDLWNWWDPLMPGYNPDNRHNVEWRWWGPEYALKICWRNWGRRLRVLPRPNLMSPAYRRACHEAMDGLMPVVMDWYQALPDAKKDLFIGLNVGWESAMGINGYYLPNGNDLVDEPPILDPAVGYVHDDVLSRGFVQIGYASVHSAALRSAGDITEDDLVEVARRHLEDLCKYAHDFGFPREKLFSHGVGNQKGEKLYEAALNRYSCPGWSNYYDADDPAANIGINRGIDLSDAPYWAAVEWLLLSPDGTNDQHRWHRAMKKTLDYRNCKLVCVYNWESIRDSREVIEAARQVIRDFAVH